MIATDGSPSYLVKYNISVGEEVLLLSNSSLVIPADASSTSFTSVIDEGEFIQSGVTVDVSVTVIGQFGRSPPSIVSTTVPGGKVML